MPVSQWFEQLLGTWAAECWSKYTAQADHPTTVKIQFLKNKKSKQALYGIVQGSRFKDLRVESAKVIGAMDFDGFGIGGEFGNDKKKMGEMIGWVVDELPEKKPRHLLGVGYLEDMELIIKSGVDTFDCTVPTHYARRGIAFTSEGKLDMRKTKYLKKVWKIAKLGRNIVFMMGRRLRPERRITDTLWHRL